MTEEQIKQKAENVYMRCFDDDLKYKGVLHALEICAGETATEATKELEKENAELKSIADFQTSSNMDRYFQLKRSEEQLTKAKEIINKFMSFQHIFYEYKDCDDLTKVLNKAKQFLKEVSE